jgi:hypothetical protein
MGALFKTARFVDKFVAKMFSNRQKNACTVKRCDSVLRRIKYPTAGAEGPTVRVFSGQSGGSLTARAASVSIRRSTRRVAPARKAAAGP